MPAYRPEIDGLRAVAVLPVMLFHAGVETFRGGFVGVDVFFVISGYLVTGLILAEGDHFSLLTFYERRARRILPALVVVLTACLGAAWWWLLPADLVAFSNSLTAVVGLSANVYFWRGAMDYFAGPTELLPLLHTWSLAVEEQYYLLFPLFLVMMRRHAARATGWALGGLAVLSLALAHAATSRAPMAAFFLLPTRGWELLLGALLAWRHVAAARPLPGTTSRAARDGLSLAGLALILYAVAAYSPAVPFPGLYALAPTVGTVLVIAYATPGTLVGRALSQPALVGVGLISYSAYLWHQPLLAFARQVSGEPLSPAVIGALLASALGLAALTWRFVEQPWRDRQRVPRRQVWRAALVSGAVLAAAGVAGIVTDGAAFRYSDLDRALVAGEAGRSTYVVARFDSRRDAAFNAADQRTKVLVIGDSFGQDLVNAMHEGGLDARLQWSTRYIAHYCGNLFLDIAAVEPRPANYDLPKCAPTLLHGDDALRARLQDADAIWLASKWQDWQVPLLARSVEAIRAHTGGRPVLVFGTKTFGTFTVRDLLGRSGEERAALTWPVGDVTARLNAAIEASLPDGVFVDLQRLACGDAPGRCRLFTADGALMSYDGAHLTAAGARTLGAALATHPLLATTR